MNFSTILVIRLGAELAGVGVVREQIDVRPNARVELLHNAADRRQAGEEACARFVAQVVTVDGRMIANFVNQLGNALASVFGIDLLPVVTADARIGNDRFQAGGLAGIERRGRHEAGHREAAIVHLFEHGRVVRHAVPCHDREERSRFGSGGL